METCERKVRSAPVYKTRSELEEEIEELKRRIVEKDVIADQKDDAIRKRDEEIDKLKQGYEHFDIDSGWEAGEVNERRDD